VRIAWFLHHDACLTTRRAEDWRAFRADDDPAAHERRASGGVRDAFAGHDAMPASAPSPATVDRADADIPIDSSWRRAGATCGARFRIRASNVDDVAMRSLCP